MQKSKQVVEVISPADANKGYSVWSQVGTSQERVSPLPGHREGVLLSLELGYPLAHLCVFIIPTIFCINSVALAYFKK